MGYCPSLLDLKEDCLEECVECWRNALEEMEVENE